MPKKATATKELTNALDERTFENFIDVSGIELAVVNTNVIFYCEQREKAN